MTQSAILFENEGELDIRALKTFGVSVKEGDSPIGFFGTGLKYAIAILLREGQTIEVHCGHCRYKFSTVSMEIRGETFSIVTMNGEELGFTIDVGKNWKLWMAYRELYCNTKDEGGTVREALEEIIPEAGKTKIVVTGEKFVTEHRERKDFILSSVPTEIFESGEIHSGETRSFFYRGIKVYTHMKPFLRKYNITKQLTLTEDRTLADTWDVKYELAKLIRLSKDQVFLREVLTAPQYYVENRLDLDWSGFPNPSEIFFEVVGDLIKTNLLKSNKSAIRIYRERYPEKEVIQEVILSTVQKTMLERAITFCINLGFPVADYPIVVSSNLGAGILGQAKDETIFLTPQAFENGTKIVAGTLLEEFIHLRHNYSDFSREFQDFCINKIISLGEEINEEPI